MLGHLLPTDPGKWSSTDGKKFGNNFDSVAPELPAYWEVLQPWVTQITRVKDDDDRDDYIYLSQWN